VVGLAVAAIPEGLPAVLTITLALGGSAWSGARPPFVARPPESLGAVTFVGQDRHNLTRNEMTVQQVFTAAHHYQVEGKGLCAPGQYPLHRAPAHL
jgi:magnesium-transporting ATPase (P-type)